MALACVAGVRLILTAYLAGAGLLFPQPDVAQQYAPTGQMILSSGWEGALLGVWQREDALWYQKIATIGYSDEDMSGQLFPLYPLAMRLLWLLSGVHPVAAGILISEFSLLGALFLLHRQLIPSFGTDVANRTLAYISLFPSAFFLHAPFSESLTLLLVVSGFALVGRGRWVEGSLVGYLAGLARPQGMLLGLPLAVAFLVRAHGRRVDGLSPNTTAAAPLRWRSFAREPAFLVRGLALVAAPVLGFATFQISVDTPWGKPGFSGGVGPMAYQRLDLPGSALINAAGNILAGQAFPIDWFDFATAVFFLALTAVCLLRLDAGYSSYALLFLAAPLSRFSPVFPLMSFSRFVLLLFPCFVVLAMWGRHKWVHLSVIFVWLSWLLVWSAKFYTGYFVG